MNDDMTAPIDILESAAEYLWNTYGKDADAAVEILRRAAFLIWQEAVPRW
jgi:hypothetical protein